MSIKKLNVKEIKEILENKLIFPYIALFSLNDILTLIRGFAICKYNSSIDDIDTGYIKSFIQDSKKEALQEYINKIGKDND